MNLISNASAVLIPVGGQGLVARGRIAVSPQYAPNPVPAWLSWGNQGRREIVLLVPVQGIQRDLALVSTEDVRSWELDPEADSWAIESVRSAPATYVRLEVGLDLSPKVAADVVRRSKELDGSLIRSAALDEEPSWLELEGTPFRVLATDAADPTAEVHRITTSTRVELFVGGQHAGVDVVILADSSGSMSIPDCGAGDRERVFGLWRKQQSPGVTRLAVLQESLDRMIEARTRISGRVSRLAVIRFSSDAHQVFPQHGGMQEFDGRNDTQAAESFRRALALLMPDGASDIGRALHAAAELLHRHGDPANEHLVVLVSDGANYTVKTADRTGELVVEVEDPVTLLQSLQRFMEFRLHAIGISTAEEYRRWASRNRPDLIDEVSLVPDHALLHRLVEVGKGDPARIGGLDVLIDYFSGIGAGLLQSIGSPAPGSLPALQPEADQAMRARVSVPQSVRQELRVLAHEAFEAYSRVVNQSRRRTGKDLFDPAVCIRVTRESLAQPALNHLAYAGWVLHMHQWLYEGVTKGSAQDYPIPEARAVLRDGRMRLVNDVRVAQSHHTVGNADQRQLSRAAQFTRDVTGQQVPVSDDAHAFSELQRALLRHATGILGDLEGAIRTGALEKDAISRAVERAAVATAAANAGQAPQMPLVVGFSYAD